MLLFSSVFSHSLCLISAIFSLFLYVSPSMPVSVLHSGLFVEKQKRRKCLAFICFFSVRFRFHASHHLPQSHSVPLSLFTPLLSLLSHVMNIMIVLPWLMIILQREDHCSNPRCSHSWYVLGRFEMSDFGPTLPPWRGNGHRLCCRWCRPGGDVIVYITFISCTCFCLWHPPDIFV